VRKLCDRVGVIRNGRLVTVEPVESLLDRSGKFVRLHAAESIPTRALEIDGVHGLESERGAGSSAGSSDGTEYAFTFTGDINTLLERLREYRLLDCTIEEAPSRRFSCGFTATRRRTPAQLLAIESPPVPARRTTVSG